MPAFATSDGRAHFSTTPLTAFTPSPGAFRLTTLRSEGQFNTVVYDEEDLYRGNRRRDVVMMSADDARALGVGEGRRVIVSTDTGQMAVSVAIVDIRPGNLAMYYPEANDLVPRRLDPHSRTPAFKSIEARIQMVG
jgi:anaerobic selenocysteine-containing dehydrogenase